MMNKYLIKGDDVLKVDGVMDHLIQRFNIDKVILVLKSMFEMLMAKIETYEQFINVKKMLDLFVSRVDLFRKFLII